MNLFPGGKQSKHLPRDEWIQHGQDVAVRRGRGNVGQISFFFKVLHNYSHIRKSGFGLSQLTYEYLTYKTMDN